MSRARPVASPPASPSEAIRAPLYALWDRYREASLTPAQPGVAATPPLVTVAPPILAAAAPPATHTTTHADLQVCLRTFLSEAGDPTQRGARLALLRTVLGPDADRLADSADSIALPADAPPCPPSP